MYSFLLLTIKKKPRKVKITQMASRIMQMLLKII